MRLPALLSVTMSLTVYHGNLMTRRYSPSHKSTRSSSSSLSSLLRNSYSHILACCSITSKFKFTRFSLVNLHMFPLHVIVFSHLLQLTCLFIFPHLLSSLLLMEFNQFQLFIILSLRRKTSGSQSSPVFYSWLSFDE